jgi:hypothetical protein
MEPGRGPLVLKKPSKNMAMGGKVYKKILAEEDIGVRITRQNKGG